MAKNMLIIYCLLSWEPVVGIEHTVRFILSAPAYSAHCRERRK